MSQADMVWTEALAHIINSGEDHKDRTGVGTTSVFGYQMQFNLTGGEMPLITVKRENWKAIVHELLWFMRGSTNIKYLNDNGIHIWDEWADEDGELGPVYGKQWRNFNCVDQLAQIYDQLRTAQESRRIILSAWNPKDVPYMKLPPCHAFTQFRVHHGQELSCHMVMRSADMFLGVPFNIASYALLTHILAKSAGLTARKLVISFGDMHIYNNHQDQVNEVLRRVTYKSGPRVTVYGVKKPWEYDFGDIELYGYTPQSAIKAPIAV